MSANDVLLDNVLETITVLKYKHHNTFNFIVADKHIAPTPDTQRDYVYSQYHSIKHTSKQPTSINWIKQLPVAAAEDII